MTTSTSTAAPTPTLGKSILSGAIAGLGGGIVFGMMMMGMLPTIAKLVGSDNPMVGLAVHLIISVVFGAIYGVIGTRFAHSYGRAVIVGIVYGVILWVFGGLIMMPLMLGMPILQIGTPQMMSLMGHVIYGVVTALLFVPLIKRFA
ncbi:MAG: hypothetical protein U0X20_15635 [Caldilineaceae bacterium]